MCTVLLPPGDNPIAFNKYIIYQYIILVLNFKQLVWYVYFGAQFMENVLFEEKQIKLEINGRKGAQVIMQYTAKSLCH